jgi:NAD(P)-dependent dehydrogenase (short-subunit alcohol dehydrogenase family)
MNCARKHTLVTGCSSGIGRSTALRLARDGQHVYAGIRKPADGDRLARSAAGGEITPVILDVTEPGHIAAAAATIDEHTGAAGLDGLVNNAGYGLACPAELVPLDSFRRQLDRRSPGRWTRPRRRSPRWARRCARNWPPGGCGSCWSSRPPSTAARPTR